MVFILYVRGQSRVNFTTGNAHLFASYSIFVFHNTLRYILIMKT